MRKLLVINLAIISALIMSSCGSSNSVVSNRLISKRKYTKGFHINKRSKMKSSDGKEEETYYAKNSKRKDKSKEVNDVKLTTKSATAMAEENNEALASYESYETSTENQYGEDSPVHDSFEDQEMVAEVQPSEDQQADVQENNTTSQQSRPDTSDPVMLVILVVLAIIIPPLAIIIYSGATNWFWIDLVLFLLAIGAFFWNPLGSLIGLAAVVIAFLVIFDVI